MLESLAYSGPMGGDEVFAMVVAMLLGMSLYGVRLYFLTELHPMTASRRLRVAAMLVTPILALALGILVNALAAADVRGDLRYVLLFTAIGVAWVEVLMLVAPPLLGILSPKEAVERRAAPSIIVHAGASAALAIAYLGGNLGDGPGWWVVLLSAALSSGALLAIWALIEAVDRRSEAVTIDRDAATAIRLSGALIAASLVLGRAVAGTWQSAANLLADFITLGWPAFVLLVAEPALHAVFRPTPKAPRPSVLTAGILPACAYIALAAWLVVRYGWWT
ncbi:MAG: hypothetical protein IBJ10_02710 [Phycisphaerales bacterium]|nr:hypothetical protein [Phycisphaerales bacterium]